MREGWDFTERMPRPDIIIWIHAPYMWINSILKYRSLRPDERCLFIGHFHFNNQNYYRYEKGGEKDE